MTDDAVKAADGRSAVLREELGRVLAELLKARAEAARYRAALERVAWCRGPNPCSACGAIARAALDGEDRT